MRWSLRPKPAGRHALGAAVTSIPSRPAGTALPGQAPAAAAPGAFATAPAPVPPWGAPEVPVQLFPHDPLPAEPAATQVVAGPPAGVVVPLQHVPTEPEPAPRPAAALHAPASPSVEPLGVLPADLWPDPLLGAVPPQPAPARPVEAPAVVPVPPTAPWPLDGPAQPASAWPVEILAQPAASAWPVEAPVVVPAQPTQAWPVEAPAQPAATATLQALPVEDLVALAPVMPPVVASAPLPPTAAAPVPASAAPVPPAGPRVELGFADGTLRVLDPASDAARALSELVGELTGPRQGASSPSESSEV